MKRVHFATFAWSVAIAGGYALAQTAERGDDLISGPAPGTALTPVMCYATDGPHSGQEFDVAKQLGENPCAVLFIHELTRNTAPVLRGLDNLASEFSILGFRSFTVMLSGDRTAGETQLKRVNGSLRLANPIVLSIDGAEGPGNYALNRRAALTLVIAKDGKVHRSLALTDTGPNDIPLIRKQIQEVAGEIPQQEGELRDLVAAQLPSETDALKQLATDQAIELRKLREQLTMLRQQTRGQMNRPAGRQPRMREGQTPPRAEQDRASPESQRSEPGQRQGKPPEDPELNTLLRSFIRKTNDRGRADEVYADIVRRAGESGDLEAEAIEMFKLMLSFPDRYGTDHAQGLAKEFLAKHKATEKKEAE